MHNALALPEILLHIFGYLEVHADLYHASLVCKGFVEPAIEHLSRLPMPLEGLLHGLPFTLTEKDALKASMTDGGYFALIRKLSAQEERLFRSKGEKVKHLFVIETTASEASPDQWETLNSQRRDCGLPEIHHRRPIPMGLRSELHKYVLICNALPSVEVFECILDDIAESLPFVSLPALTDMRITFRQYSTAILIAISTMHPRLRRLSLSLRLPMMESSYTFSSHLRYLFQGAPLLEEVELDRDFVTHMVLGCLGELPNLVSLRIRGALFSNVLSKYMDYCRSTRQPHFPVLQQLKMTITPRNVPPFFSDPLYISSTTVHGLELTYRSNTGYDVHMLFDRITVRWPKLKRLDLKLDNEFYDFIEQDESMQKVYEKPNYVQRVTRFLITKEVLRPLFDLSELQELILEWPYALRLERADLDLMAASWPNVTNLYLAPIPFFILPERPPVHLEWLQAFSASTALKKLSMFVDAVAPATQDPTLASQVAGNKSLETFDPGRSWINDERYAAATLRTMFPNVLLPGLKERKTQWGAVARLLWSCG